MPPTTPAPPGVLLAAIASVARRLRDLRAAVGVVLLAGIAISTGGILAFAWVAARVVSGRTQTIDDAILTALGQHRSPALESIMLEVTLLGTGIVVGTLAVVVALFLALTRHRASAALLLASTLGALALNDVLKSAFARPRPHVIAWEINVSSSSFPSGHAMSAAAVYATIALLAARLQPERGPRVLIVVVAAIITIAIGFSRLYLGVHYPSDVLAGLVVGWAWAAFCATTLEAVQLVVRREHRRRGDALEGVEDVVDPATPTPAAPTQAAGPTNWSNSRS